MARAFIFGMKKYDFIIAGGGMAGLSLAYHLSQSPLRERSILILDREDKTKNDRTWCFWERGEGPFESIVFRQWPSVNLYGTTYSGPLDMDGYQYKMIRGIDFYEHVRGQLAKHPAIELKQVGVQRIAETPQGGFVLADDQPYIADYIFDSTHPLKLDEPHCHNLLQHFKGWIIHTDKPSFDPGQPTMMDFRVAQQDDCRFVYVLPFDNQTALVEYTLFTEALLPEEEYDARLKAYVNDYLTVGNYEVIETEYGVIPMTDVSVNEYPAEHIIRIGTSGGYTKASTGYTFQRTQRYLRDLVNQLVSTGKPVRRKSWFDQRFSLYDSVFLNVLQNRRHPADDVFTRLYERNHPRQVFRFLDEDTTLAEELQIMSTVPLGAFTKAVFDVLRKKTFIRK